MRTTVLRLVNLLALLGAIVWLARAPDWEPLVTSVGLFGVLVGHEFKLQRNDGRDRSLFERFLADLPSAGRSLRFLEHQDIGASFHSDDLSELDHFAQTWENAEHEFQDQKLEVQRKKLLQALRTFRNELSVNIFAGRPSGFLTMDLNDHEDRPEVWATRNRLNNLASVVHVEHQELVRLGRRRIAAA